MLTDGIRAFTDRHAHKSLVGWWKDPGLFKEDAIVQQRTYERYLAERQLKVGFCRSAARNPTLLSVCAFWCRCSAPL